MGRVLTAAPRSARTRPARPKPRLLLEATASPQARGWRAQLSRAGFAVDYCSGPAEDGANCPLLAGDSCPRVDAAGLVVHALPGRQGEEIRRSLTRRGVGVVALTGPGAAVASGGGHELPADQADENIVDAVGQTYSSRWRRLRLHIRLSGDRLLLIRPAGPADAERMRDFYLALSPASLGLRFLGAMSPPALDLATRMADVDFLDRFALVAVSDAGGTPRIVADCRLIPASERPGCVELAVAVADEFQGAGLGRHLIELILAIAADRLERETAALVRYDNEPMKHLLRDLGFKVTEWELGVITFVCRPSGEKAS